MPIYLLGEELLFPPPEEAEEDGVLAIGGDLRPERLILAYKQGIFPWYSEDTPIVWHSPDPRMVLWGPDIYINRSLKKTIRRQPYHLTMDVAFAQVIEACAHIPRPGQSGTWIVDEMAAAYTELHDMGYAHSVEAWDGETLVGGVYGVCVGAAFFGESMFARAPNASKIAFATLVRQLESWGIPLIDCQVYTEHLQRFGAREWSRARYLHALRKAVSFPTRRGQWQFER